MYHKIGIQKLSPAQISKLLNGHAVTVKHGTTHDIPVSTEQHKKITSAHKKGKGVRVTADPYQRDMMRGAGIFENFKKLVKEVYHQNKKQIHKIVKPIAHQAVDYTHEYIKPHIHHHLGDLGTKHLGNLAQYAHQEIGEGVHKHRGRPRKQHGKGPFEDFFTKTIPSIGHEAGEAYKGTVGLNPFDEGYKFGYNTLGPAIFGEGVHKHRPKARGRPRKQQGKGPFEDFFTKTVPSIGHDAGEAYKGTVGLNPFDEGYKFGYNTLGPAIFGEGKKKSGSLRGGSLSGGALLPAGYGQGRRGRKGKGQIGDAIASKIGQMFPF